MEVGNLIVFSFPSMTMKNKSKLVFYMNYSPIIYEENMFTFH